MANGSVNKVILIGNLGAILKFAIFQVVVLLPIWLWPQVKSGVINKRVKTAKKTVASCRSVWKT